MFCSPEDFLEGMRRFTAAVVMVVTWVITIGDWLLGLTISACCSLSTKTPARTYLLGRAVLSRSTALDQRRFAVSVLGLEHADLAALAAEDQMQLDDLWKSDVCEISEFPNLRPEPLGDAAGEVRLAGSRGSAVANGYCAGFDQPERLSP